MIGSNKPSQINPQCGGGANASSEQDRAKLETLRDRFVQSRRRRNVVNWFTTRTAAGDQTMHCHAAVICLEIDRFEMYSGNLGREVGDQILNAVLARLAGSSCLHDPLIGPAYGELEFSGGAKFTIFMAGVSGQAEVKELASRLRNEIAAPLEALGFTLHLSISAGIAVGSFGGSDTEEDLFADADAALAHAKSNGKGQSSTFDSAIRDAAMQRLHLERDLRAAIAGGELRVVYQPILCLETAEIDGFEALVRWDHPTLGTISPVDFIPIAEETGLIVGIDKYVLSQACHELCRIDSEFPDQPADRPFSINVNVSQRQLIEPGFCQFVQEVLKQTRLSPERLHLEVTESSVMDNSHAVVPSLWEVRALGVRIAMDAFGVGHSSLSRLQNFPLDYLKLDRALLRKMTINRRHAVVVNAIASMARDLGMRVVAEGIELAEQVTLLQSIGCDLAQGFLFSKPVTPTELRSFLADRAGPIAIVEQGACCAATDSCLQAGVA